MKKFLSSLLLVPALLVLYPICLLLTLGVMLHDATHGRGLRR